VKQAQEAHVVGL